MKARTFVRHIREGLKSVFRNGWMSFASISAIAISLFILGGFLLLTLNVNQWADELENQVEISVYLDVNVSEEEIMMVQNEIGSLPNVSQVTFVSKEEGLAEMKEKMGDENRNLLEGYEGDNNPLPDAFVVRVSDPLVIADVAEQIEQIDTSRSTPLIFDVKYGADTVEVLFQVTRFVRNVGLILVGGLAFTAMFLIANTIKLTIMARQREISIMKLVGATNHFIRWPFFIEGAILGLVGSLIPLGILLLGYQYIVEQSILEMGLLMIQLIPMEDIFWLIFSLLVGIGLVIGIWGSTLSVRKFLKI